MPHPAPAPARALKRTLGLLALLAAVALAVVWWPTLWHGARRSAVDGHAPAPVAGTPLHLTLAEPPAEAYGPQAPRPEDAPRAAAVAASGGVWDPALAQAARELARHYARVRGLLPGDALQFILDAAGATVWGARQTVLVTDAAADRAWAEALADQGAGGVFRAGLGEVELKSGVRVVAVISAQPTLVLDPVPSQPEADALLPITGTVDARFGDLHALALGPEGEFIDLPVTLTGRRFSTALQPTPGPWLVELLAVGPHGPTPLAQLSLWADEALPRRFEGHWPPEDEGDVIAAAVARVQASRAEHGLPALRVDARLTEAARVHNADMQRHRFLGHQSPRTGGAADRVRATGYRAVSVAENVAFNRALDDAHRGLMRSLGHRRNLLSPRMTHLGLDATLGEQGWYLTQVFGQPRPVIADFEAAAALLLARLNGADAAEAQAQADAPRRAAGRRVSAAATRVRRSPTLDRIAAAEARSPRPEPRRALDAVAAAGTTGRVTAWVATLGALEHFEPPAGLEDLATAEVGIGVHQRPATDGPDIQVVVLVVDAAAEPPRPD